MPPIIPLFWLLLLLTCVTLVAFFIVFWYSVFTDMMAAPDASYPGAHDKILWVVLFLCLPFFAPFMYRSTMAKYTALLQVMRHDQ